MYYIIVGASRGLGAALVQECLAQKDAQVIGLGRSEPESIPPFPAWHGSGRFRYYCIDISREGSRAALDGICKGLPPVPVCVLFNAALIRSDIDANGELAWDEYDAVSRTTINGFGAVVASFGTHLRAYRGLLVGISSTVAWTPLLHEKMVSYPASKAFLTMALRSLRLLWGGRCNIMTVHLGHVGDRVFTHLPGWIVPSYRLAAKKIIEAASRRSPPRHVAYPFLTTVVYGLLARLPDGIAFAFFRCARRAAGRRQRASSPSGTS